MCRYLGLGETDGSPSGTVLGRLSAAQVRRPSACREGKKPKVVSQHGVGRLERLENANWLTRSLPLGQDCPGTVPGFYTSLPSLADKHTTRPSWFLLHAIYARTRRPGKAK